MGGEGDEDQSVIINTLEIPHPGEEDRRTWSSGDPRGRGDRLEGNGTADDGHPNAVETKDDTKDRVGTAAGENGEGRSSEETPSTGNDVIDRTTSVGQRPEVTDVEVVIDKGQKGQEDLERKTTQVDDGRDRDTLGPNDTKRKTVASSERENNAVVVVVVDVVVVEEFAPPAANRTRAADADDGINDIVKVNKTFVPPEPEKTKTEPDGKTDGKTDGSRGYTPYRAEDERKDKKETTPGEDLEKEAQDKEKKRKEKEKERKEKEKEKDLNTSIDGEVILEATHVSTVIEIMSYIE